MKKIIKGPNADQTDKSSVMKSKTLWLDVETIDLLDKITFTRKLKDPSYTFKEAVGEALRLLNTHIEQNSVKD